MERREYIVALKEGVDYNKFWNEMETVTTRHPFIPDQVISIVNERPGSTRSCHYSLTDTEAEQLRIDPRVYTVEIPPDQRADIQIGLRFTSQPGNFEKTTSDSGSFINWGLRRCIEYANIYGTSSTAVGDYTYVNDGTGVDIVVQDSGLQVDHPEFFNALGGTRVEQIDWYTASGLPGTQSSVHYRDYDGHGTHVAGIAAGKNYGWAKNSKIYSLKIRGLEGASDIDPITGQGSGIPISDAFDVIKLWHLNKPIDPATGYKRPTVVNMSWGYFSTYVSINGGSYRGILWAGTSRRPEYGMFGSPYGAFFNGSAQVPSVNSDVEELIAAGVVVCIAAGNNSEKVDVFGGLDYDNYYTKTGVGNIYYHRGASPQSPNAISVGSIDSSVYSASLDQKSTFSNQGPGVDISAPGSNIMSATSNTNKWGDGSQNYYLNSSYKQTNISGTSMASPQVAGVAALYLQSNPAATPANVKTFLVGQTDPLNDRIYETGVDNDYPAQRSTWGGNQNVLFWPYAVANPELDITTRISGGITLKGSISLKFN